VDVWKRWAVVSRNLWDAFGAGEQTDGRRGKLRL